MRKTYSYLALTGLILSLGLLSACTNSGGSGAPAPAPIPVQPCQGPTCSLALPPGTKLGFYAQTSNMDTYLQNAGSTYSVTSNYRLVLKTAMGVCDRQQTNGGTANCDAWASNAFHDIVIQVDSSTQNKVQMTLRSYPNVCNGWGCAWYSYTLPRLDQFFLGLFGIGYGNMSGVYNPLRLDTTIWPINEDKGFELRGYGPAGSFGYNLLFQMQVLNGKLEDQSFDFKLFFNGDLVGNGRLVRCQTQTCGL